MSCKDSCANCAKSGAGVSKLNPGETLKAVGVLFALPFAAFCLGCFIGFKYFKIEGYTELTAVFTGFIFMAAGYLLIKISRKGK